MDLIKIGELLGLIVSCITIWGFFLMRQENKQMKENHFAHMEERQDEVERKVTAIFNVLDERKAKEDVFIADLSSIKTALDFIQRDLEALKNDKRQ